MLIEMKDVSLAYVDGKSERKIFDGVNISFREKATHVFLGPSGTGKSSLLYILSGLRDINSGQILYDGVNLSKTKEKEDLRFHNFGFVFQQHYLIPYLNVLENICMVDRKQKLVKEAQDILEKMNIQDLMYKKVYELSGGQKQRIAIARALVKKPQVIFADEPTASLDRANAHQIYELLQKFSGDSQLFIATHDIEILNGSEEVYYLDNKKIWLKEGVLR